MSGGLTADQVQLARTFLLATTAGHVFPEIVESALFAIFTVLICISTVILISKGLGNWVNRAMLMVTLAMYGISAVLWALNIKLMWNELNVLIPGLLSTSSLSSTYSEGENDTYELNFKWFFIGYVVYQVNIILSDAVVLWRVFVIWNRRKSVVGAIAVIFVSLLGVTTIYILSLVAAYFPASVPKSFLSLTYVMDQLSGVSYSLSAFANMWATCMVACKAWIHRQDIRRFLQNRAAKSSVENILVMLVESGIVYSTLMIIMMLTSFPSIKSLDVDPFDAYYNAIMNQVSGMYPTLVIVLAGLQMLHGNHQFSFVEKGPDGTLPFSFRVPHSQTSQRISIQETHISLEVSPEGAIDQGSDSSKASPGVFNV
ncbi:hypothetical protein OF83DRAFT_1176369 [Amylostereum chailletii]|nr:hypothetical protein OF83DRAFT_1176369 [Amylostereum chailletii]